MAVIRIQAQKDARCIQAVCQIRGDRRTQILRFDVNRFDGGVDLGDLRWVIKTTNALGKEDIFDPEVVEIRERTIVVDWLVDGSVTDATGMASYELNGIDTTEEGQPVQWSGGIGSISVRTGKGPQFGESDSLTNIEKLILYVDGELQAVVDAGEAAGSAADRANAAAESIEDFNAAMDRANTAATRAENAAEAVEDLEGAVNRANAAAEAATNAALPAVTQYGLRVKGEVATATGNPVTFLPDAGSLLDVTTVFEPKQEGAGEASPENPRPISPWDGISLQHGETVYNDAFDTPIPGGSKNWLSGVLTQDWYIQELSGASKETWKFSNSQSGSGVYRYDGTVSGSRRSAGNECICSHAVHRGVNEPGIWLTNTTSTSNTVLAVRFMGTWPTLEDFKAWLADAKPQIAYRIARPEETQLTPAITAATDPEQENTLSGDGEICVDYVKPLHVSIDERVAAAVAAMTNG